ncbi:MAG: hypothetical protein MPW15_04205 [Candidatus Manganitrophus sp.]|nr:hypothetical protein [Candidatus Manganitrophus sp.]
MRDREGTQQIEQITEGELGQLDHERAVRQQNGDERRSLFFFLFLLFFLRKAGRGEGRPASLFSFETEYRKIQSRNACPINEPRDLRKTIGRRSASL